MLDRAGLCSPAAARLGFLRAVDIPARLREGGLTDAAVTALRSRMLAPST